MLNRLPISLAQSKAGNNSEKPKIKVRQILHSLYRSEKPTKKIYKSLTDIIFKTWKQFLRTLKIVKHLSHTDLNQT